MPLTHSVFHVRDSLVESIFVVLLMPFDSFGFHVYYYSRNSFLNRGAAKWNVLNLRFVLAVALFLACTRCCWSLFKCFDFRTCIFNNNSNDKLNKD